VDWPGVLANDTDPDGDPLSAVKDSEPSMGTLILKSSGDFLYSPAPGASGIVTFTYHAHDGTASSNVATVVITVTAGNSPPTISDIPDQVTKAGTPAGPVALTVGDLETPVEDLTLTGTSSNTALVPVENIVFGGSGANRTLTITPAAGQTGAATLTITVDDGSATASDNLLLRVEPFGVYLPLLVRN
jgi:hypothetical protein